MNPMIVLGYKPNGLAWRYLVYVGPGEKAGRI